MPDRSHWHRSGIDSSTLGTPIVMYGWVALVAVLSTAAFQRIPATFVTVSEPWHQRVVDSSAHLALALFFLLLICLGHALTIGGNAIQSSTAQCVYRVLVMPGLVAVSLLSFWPVTYPPAYEPSIGTLVLLLIWYAAASDPFGSISSRFSNTDWFQRVLEGSGGGMRRGMKGRVGFFLFNGGLLLLLFAGLSFACH